MEPQAKFEWDGGAGTLTVNEYGLHDIMCSLTAFGSGLDLPNRGFPISYVKIVLDEPENFPDTFVREWEDKIMVLLKTMSDLDCEWHDVAEHTCT